MLLLAVVWQLMAVDAPVGAFLQQCGLHPHDNGRYVSRMDLSTGLIGSTAIYAISKNGPALLECIGKAIGWTIEVSRAEALAKAKIVGEAKANIEAIELYQQAGLQFLAEQVMQQNTLVEISSRALPLLKDDARPHDVSADWIRNFYDKCRLTSDNDMKGLWAKILAGEANVPGAFSKRTVNIVAELDRSDAEDFSKVASFVLEGAEPILAILNWNHDFFRGAGISHKMLLKLEDTGLLNSETMNGYSVEVSGSQIDFRYFDETIRLTRPEYAKGNIAFSIFHLTTTGRQLYPVCGPIKNPEFLSYLVEEYKEPGFQDWTAEILRKPTSP